MSNKSVRIAGNTTIGSSTKLVPVSYPFSVFCLLNPDNFTANDMSIWTNARYNPASVYDSMLVSLNGLKPEITIGYPPTATSLSVASLNPLVSGQSNYVVIVVHGDGIPLDFYQGIVGAGYTKNSPQSTLGSLNTFNPPPTTFPEFCPSDVPANAPYIAYNGLLQDFALVPFALTDDDVTTLIGVLNGVKPAGYFKDYLARFNPTVFYHLDEPTESSTLTDYGSAGADINITAPTKIQYQQPGLERPPAGFVSPPPGGVTKYHNFFVPRNLEMKSIRYIYPFDSINTIFPLKDLSFKLSSIQSTANDNGFFPLTMSMFLKVDVGTAPTFDSVIQNELFPMDISQVTANKPVFFDLMSADNFTIDINNVVIPDNSQGEIIIEFFNFPYKPKVYTL